MGMSMHEYEKSSGCKVCFKCGTAKHRSGWYWYAGRRSRDEPPCGGVGILSGLELERWLASAETPSEDVDRS